MALAQTLGVDIFSSHGKVALVDGRKGQQLKRSCSEVSWVIGSSPGDRNNRQTRKNRLHCEVSAGVWNRESGGRAGAVMVHASPPVALSQESTAGA